jgi:histone H3/H4
LFFAKLPFARLCRDITKNVAPNEELKFQGAALEALQYSSEMFLTNVLEMANLASIHAHRETLMLQDMQLVYAVHSMASGSIIHELKSNLQADKQIPSNIGKNPFAHAGLK